MRDIMIKLNLLGLMMDYQWKGYVSARRLDHSNGTSLTVVSIEKMISIKKKVMYEVKIDEYFGVVKDNAGKHSCIRVQRIKEVLEILDKLK